MISPAELERLKKIAEASTKVVAWYPHMKEVRGPFNRWFTISDVAPQYQKHVAHTADDARFAAEAMNNMLKLIKCIEDLRKQRDMLELQLGIENMVIGRHPDDPAEDTQNS